MGCKTAGNLLAASSCFCRASTRVVAAGDGFSWSSWHPPVCLANVCGLKCTRVIPTKGWDRGAFCPPHQGCGTTNPSGTGLMAEDCRAAPVLCSSLLVRGWCRVLCPNPLLHPTDSA